MKRLLFILLLSMTLVSSLGVSAPIQQSPPTKQQQGNPNVKVWVNTGSGVYHCPGTRWYGTTKHGEYMTQKEALAKGNRPAYGKYCY